MSEVPEHANNPRSEWLKFITLAVIMLVIILGVALLRPLIFNQIVPAILGENEPPAAEVVEPSTIDSGAMSGEDVSDEDEDASAMDEESTDDASANETESEDTASDDSADDEDPETAVDESEQETHTVEFGQNLYQIARRYGVTVDALIEANEITDPDIVKIGDVLVIPSE